MELNAFKEQLKSTCDIVDVIGSYITVKRAGTNYRALCPFHNEKTPSFTIYPADQAYYCFGCRKGGDVIRFVMDHEGVDFIIALKSLASRAGLPFPEPSRPGGDRSAGGKSSLKSREQYYSFFDDLANWYRKNLHAPDAGHALEYVRKRALSDAIVSTFGIGYAPDQWRAARAWGERHGHSLAFMVEAGVLSLKQPEDPKSAAYDRFRNRLMFPICNEHGRVIAFSGRKLDPDVAGAKYINNPETALFHKGRVLYGLHLAREGIKSRGFALLCEGQMDVIACHKAGLTNALAPMGTAFTAEQARLLRRYTDTLVIMFDSDTAGTAAALKAVDAFLPAGLKTRVVTLPEGTDPDSLIGERGVVALQERVDEACDFFIFFMENAMRNHDVTTPTGKAEISEAFLTVVARLDSFVGQAEYCRILSQRLKVPEHAVSSELQRILKKQTGAVSSVVASRTAVVAVEPAPIVGSNPESILLQLAVHHQRWAQQLIDELPVSMISQTPSGRALNEVLAMAEQGEWSDAADVLAGKLADYDSGEVGKALFDPDFGRDCESRKLSKAYADCLYRGILIPGIDRTMVDLQTKMQASASRAERTAMQRKIITLRTQKSKLYNRLREGE